jgi:hypothetical protein
MTERELRAYEEAHVSWVGAASPVPLPFFYEIGKMRNGLWCLPVDVEVNIISIVYGGYGWWPLKAEPFIKRLWIGVFPNHYKCQWSYNTENLLVWDEKPLPHINGYACYEGKHLAGHLQSQDDLKKIADYVGMVVAEINLGSLMGLWNRWDERIFRFIPPKLHDAIKKYWNAGRPSGMNLSDIFVTRDYEHREMDNLTWSGL